MEKSSFYCACQQCHSKVHSIFNALNLEELGEIDVNKTCKVYKKGEYLFKEDSYPTGLFCVNFGKIKLTTNGENGREHIIRLLKEGEVAGQSAVFADDRHHSSAIALEDTGVCFIPKSAFLHLVQGNHTLTMEVLKTLSKNLEASQDKLLDLAQKSVKERLAEALLYFRTTYGENKEHFLNVQFSREEIADFVGTSTETIIRLLSDWNTNNIITLSKKKIRIESLDKICEIAGD